MALALEEVWGRVKNVCKQNGLLILSVLAVVIGCLLGFFLRGKQLSEQVSWWPWPPPCPDFLPSLPLYSDPPTLQDVSERCPQLSHSCFYTFPLSTTEIPQDVFEIRGLTATITSLTLIFAPVRVD